MVATFLSVILALLLWVSPYSYDAGADSFAVKTLMIAISIAFLFFIPLSMMFAWLPLQKAEQNQTPRLLEILKKDKWILLENGWLTAFSLVTLVLATSPLYIHAIEHHWFLSCWIILLGTAIDCLHGSVIQILNYLNPCSVISMFAAQAKKSIQDDKELDFCSWIDSLSEIAIKGIQRQSTSIANLVLNEEQGLVRLFLGASKSIGHKTQDAQMKSVGIVDKVGYTMFYVYQRLDILFEKSLSNKLEPTCSLIVTSLGKIALDAAHQRIG